MCISYRLLCSTITTNLETQNNTHLLSQSFCRSGNQAWLCWVPCVKSLHRAVTDVLAKAGVSAEDWIVEGSTSRLTWLLVGFSSLRTVGQRASVPSCLLAGGLCSSLTWQLASSKHANWEGSGRSLLVKCKSKFYVLLFCGTSNYLCLLLFVNTSC